MAVNTAFNMVTQSIEGVNLTQVYDPPTNDYPGYPAYPGEKVTTTGGGTYVFGLCAPAATIAAWDCVWIDASFAAVQSITQALYLTSGTFGFNQSGSALTSAQGTWFMTEGVPVVNISGTITKDLPLYVSSATAGALSITTSSLSGGQVMGATIVTSTAIGGTGLASAAYVTVIDGAIVRRPAT